VWSSVVEETAEKRRDNEEGREAPEEHPAGGRGVAAHESGRALSATTGDNGDEEAQEQELTEKAAP
jgi:hypothetical protein